MSSGSTNFITHKITGTSARTLAAIAQEIEQLRNETPEREEFVFLNDLAKVIHLDKSNLRKFVKKMGIKPHKQKAQDKGYQLAFAVTKEEAKKIICERERQGLIRVEEGIVEPPFGVFYIIRLIPDIDKKRIKVGFTGNLETCMQQYKKTSPMVTFLKSWPCKQVWKLTAIDSIVSIKCRAISDEVFECDNFKALLRRGDAFFALLPRIERSSKGKKE